MLLPILFLAAVSLVALSGLPGLLRPRIGSAAAVAMTLAGAGMGLAAALVVLFGVRAWTLDLGWSLPGARFALRCDAIGALFLIPVLLVPALGTVYGCAYWSDAEHPDSAPRLRFFYGLTAACMALLCVAANGILFLVAWEAMALLGFLMVTVEDRDPEVRDAGWVYLVAAHAGTLCLLAGFALLATSQGSFALGPLPQGFAASPRGTATFLLLLLGFGLKAGLMPLHVWLPVAHAAAPSHVSALLSGLMIKMGILGLARILAWTPDPPLWWGGLLVGLGALSGILGVAYAIGQHDLKRLLAYHSVENIGIIALGLGLAFAGKALGNPALLALGAAGALLHVLNHALFKPLLFLAAGSVVHVTGSRDMDRLGGLAKAMPWTAGAFLAGAVAICGLPPFNGFVSEWLLYVGAFKSLASGGWAWAVVVPAALALIGGLAAACFVKAYGAVFLGESRTGDAERRHESSRAMLVPMAVLAGLCALIGLVPVALRPALDRLVACVSGPAEPVRIGALLSLGTLSAMAAVVLAFAGCAWVLLRRVPFRVAPTWDCGYAAPTARIQYTSSSFAGGLVELFAWALLPVEHRPRISGLFPRNGLFSSHVPDAMLDRALRPAFRLSAWMATRARVAQGGLLPVYLLYIALMLVALFAWTLA